jgi:ABC-type lipoprotein export system ATPase subunit
MNSMNERANPVVATAPANDRSVGPAEVTDTPVTEPPVVETRALVKVYGEAEPVRALDGVDLTIRRGEYVAIVGPSGSGKSTLLHLLGALDRPTSGEVIVDGTSISQVKDLDRFRSRTVGFIFQAHNLIPTLSALENVEVPMFETISSGRERRSRAAELLGLVGLGDRPDALPSQLSGGQRQRVAIARSLANQPAIVLADEPTGNLDSKTTGEILDLLATLNRERNTTIIVVTHNHQVSRATRRVITLRDGRVQGDVEVGTGFDGDLVEWKQSALGQMILRGEDLPAEWDDISARLRELLAGA